MGTYRSELRRQHRNTIQHVLLWAYPCIPHTGNSHILLEGFVLTGFGGGFELQESFVSFLLKVHLGEDLLHICCIAESFLSALAADYLLELCIGDPQEACKRLLHYRIGQGAVQLDICPLVSVRAEDVLTEEPSGDRPEVLLLVGICGLELSGACKLVDILIGEGKDGEAFVVPLYLHARALEMCKELLMRKRLSGDCGDLACSYGAPEVAIGLASDKLGIMEEIESVVTC